MCRESISNSECFEDKNKVKYPEHTSAFNNSELNVAHVKRLEHYVRHHNDRLPANSSVPINRHKFRRECFEYLVSSKGWGRANELDAL